MNDHSSKINTDFHGKKLSKEGSHYTFVLVVVIASVCKIIKNYYP